jgi:hypothetical protein
MITSINYENFTRLIADHLLSEYVIPNDSWQLALQDIIPVSSGLPSSSNHIGLWGRAMQTEMMAKSSHDALVDAEPEIRPYVLTRSATAGTMRYAASSWSGDNVTSWDGMKGANALSLNAGMSLLQVCNLYSAGCLIHTHSNQVLVLRSRYRRFRRTSTNS